MTGKKRCKCWPGLWAIGFLAIVTSPLNAHTASEQHTVSDGRVTYLANEALMVEYGRTKLLFDPFFHRHYDTYAMVPDSTKAKILAGDAPFDDIKAIFVSHAHGDHFSDTDMLTYLTQHSAVHLYAPRQAIEQLTFLNPSDTVLSRLHSIALEIGQQPTTLRQENIHVEAVRIPHAGWPGRANVENLIFRVAIGGDANHSNEAIVVMHMGDADPNKNHYLPFNDHWQKRQTSLGFPPYWFYLTDEGNQIVDSLLNIRKSVGVHVPLIVPKKLENSGKDFFSQSGETRDIVD